MSESFDQRLRFRSAAIILAVYFLLAALVVYQSADQINPDGVAYVQIARHYAHGRFDLAVSSYWGPLLSWLLVPLVWLGIGSMAAVKAINVVLGAGLGLAAVSLARRVKLNWNPNVVLAGSLTLVLAMLPQPITPDVLLATLMTLYFARSARLLRSRSAKVAFGAGLIGGAAYLAKAYALAFVPLHLALTLAVGLSVRGGLGARTRQLVAGLAGVALVAGPWVVAVSVKEGRPTIGSVTRLADAFVYSIKTGQNCPLYRVQTPRPGRINVWENPTEIPQDYVDAARPPENYRSRILLANGNELNNMLRWFDPIVPLAVGWVIVVLSIPVQLLLRAVDWRGPQTPRKGRPVGTLGVPRRIWLAGSVAVYAGGYMLVLMESRYLWPIWALLLVLTLGVLGASPGGRAGRWRLLAPALLLGAVAGAVAMSLYPWFDPSPTSKGADWRQMAKASSGLQSNQLTAANVWHEGLYASYRADSPFLGVIEGQDAEEIARGLRPFGPVRVLVFNNAKLERMLESSGLFRRDSAQERADNLAVFELAPAAEGG